MEEQVHILNIFSAHTTSVFKWNGYSMGKTGYPRPWASNKKRVLYKALLIFIYGVMGLGNGICLDVSIHAKVKFVLVLIIFFHQSFYWAVHVICRGGDGWWLVKVKAESRKRMFKKNYLTLY